MAEKCLSFDGTDDYVVTTYAPTYGLTDDFTWECWIKTSDTGSDDANAIAVGRHSNSLATDNITLFVYGGKIRVSIKDEDGGDSRNYDDTTFVADGNWHYIVLKRDTAVDKFYFVVDNGTPEEWTDNSIGNIRLTNQFMFGCRNYSGSYGYDFTGLIDEIRISNKARSSAEISAIWNGGSGVQFEVDANTVALWHFNEGAGATAFDETNNDNDGTITGASWVDGYDFLTSHPTSSETGQGLEASLSGGTYTLSETGQGVESLLLDAVYILSEVGQGTGAASIVKTGADAGNGVETLTSLISALAKAETGSGTEALATLLALTSSSEAGSGADLLRAKIEHTAGGDIKLPSGGQTSIPSRKVGI